MKLKPIHRHFIFLFELYLSVTHVLPAISLAIEIPPPVYGMYSAFTEADWTVGFELKPGGKATITLEYSYDYDAKGKKQERSKTVEGTWEYNQQQLALTLTYEGFKDRLIRSSGCYEKKPCFKYGASIEKTSAKSPLNVPYEFINWGNPK